MPRKELISVLGIYSFGSDDAGEWCQTGLCVKGTVHTGWIKVALHPDTETHIWIFFPHFLGPLCIPVEQLVLGRQLDFYGGLAGIGVVFRGQVGKASLRHSPSLDRRGMNSTL